MCLSALLIQHGALNWCVALLSRAIVAFINTCFTQREQFCYLPKRDFRANEETHLSYLGVRVLIRGGNEEKNNLFLEETFRKFNKLGASKMFRDLVEFLTSAITRDESKFIAVASNQQWVSIQCRILNQSEPLSMLQIKCKLEVWLNRSGLCKKHECIVGFWGIPIFLHAFQRQDYQSFNEDLL